MRRWSNHSDETPNEKREKERERERERWKREEKKKKSVERKGSDKMERTREKGSRIGGYRPLQRRGKYRPEIELPGKVSWKRHFSRSTMPNLHCREKGGAKTFHSLVLTRAVYSTSARLLCILKDPKASFILGQREVQALFSSGKELCIVFQLVRFILTRNRCAHTCGKKTDTHKRGCIVKLILQVKNMGARNKIKVIRQKNAFSWFF